MAELAIRTKRIKLPARDLWLTQMVNASTTPIQAFPAPFLANSFILSCVSGSGMILRPRSR